MTYYVRDCVTSKGFIDIFDDTGLTYCCNPEFNYTDTIGNYTIDTEDKEFHIEVLSKIKHVALDESKENNDRKAFLKKAVEWYIKERLCIELD